MRRELAAVAVAMAAVGMAGLGAARGQEMPAVGLKRLQAVPFTAVKVRDAFWAGRIETNRTKSIPHNFAWCRQTGRFSNFAKAAGLMKGEFQGIYFNDSDVYKLLEGASYSLQAHPDPNLDKQVDEVIAWIAAAQRPDGYLNTYYTLKEPGKRWTNLGVMHELYCSGHLFEAAVAHFRATGKRTLLDVAVKLADHIDGIFGPDKRHDVPGHEEIELALVKLAAATGQDRYLRLAKFFLDTRGRKTDKRPKLYGNYCQDHQPVVEQSEPTGHAVRAMYLYSGMADVAAATGDAAYVAALGRLWANTVGRKMYVTGAIGSTRHGEAFGKDYELPNDTAYCETCASIGMCLWNHRMNLLHGDARYADTFERTLFNGFLAGVDLGGKRFFYVNPLASRGNHHRQPFFDCACCPTNVVRFIPSVGGYVYAVGEGSLYVNLYVASDAKVSLAGQAVAIAQETRYPWDGRIRLTVTPERAAAFDLMLRIPAWCAAAAGQDNLYRPADVPMEQRRPTIKVNGSAAAGELEMAGGYARLRRAWKSGDAVELELPMPIRRVYAHPSVEADAGRVALQRGPILYCLEAADHAGRVDELYLPREAELAAQDRPALPREGPLAGQSGPGVLGGVTVIGGKAMSRRAAPAKDEPADLLAVPYYLWDHRQAGAMQVWIAEDPAKAIPRAAPTAASGAAATASHTWRADHVAALNDGIEPARPNSERLPPATERMSPPTQR